LLATLSSVVIFLATFSAAGDLLPKDRVNSRYYLIESAASQSWDTVAILLCPAVVDVFHHSCTYNMTRQSISTAEDKKYISVADSLS
jgi:hypothetical protein